MPCSNAIISLAIALNAISITQIFVSASRLSLCVSHFSFAFLFSFGHEVSLALLRCFAFAFWTIYWVREMTITKDLTRENSKWRKKRSLHLQLTKSTPTTGKWKEKINSFFSVVVVVERLKFNKWEIYWVAFEWFFEMPSNLFTTLHVELNWLKMFCFQTKSIELTNVDCLTNTNTNRHSRCDEKEHEQLLWHGTVSHSGDDHVRVKKENTFVVVAVHAR